MHICSNCGHTEHIFGAGGGERMAKEYDVNYLGGLPLDIRIRQQADSGRPTVVADPDGELARDLSPDRPQGGGQDRREGARHVAQVPVDRGAEHVTIKSDKWIRRMAAEHRHDRAVRARAGPRGRRPPRGVVRHVELRLRHPLRRRVQDLHQHQQHHRRSEELRREVVRRLHAATSASSRRIRSRWPARWSTSAFRATC